MLQDRRDKAQHEYEEYKQKQRATHAARMAARRGNADKMRQDVEAAHTGASKKLEAMKTGLANQARAEKAAWAEQLRKNEEARLARARANRKHAEEVRQRMRNNLENQRKTREEAGTRMQRQVDAEVVRARNELTGYKRRLRAERYQARYASVDEAKALEQSTFRKLYGLTKPTFSPTQSRI